MNRVALVVDDDSAVLEVITDMLIVAADLAL